MKTLQERYLRIKQNAKVDVALVSCPTPVLLDKTGTPYSPVRTNYFPHAQVLVATETKEEMKRKCVEGEVKIVDLKSLEKPDEWRAKLTPYGELQHGERKLTKNFIGDGMQRITELGEYDVVGITSNFTSEANSVRTVIEKATKHNSNAIIVVGGRDASVRPQFYRKIGADIVATGDSDISFPNFVCDLVSGGTINIGELPSQRAKVLPQLDFGLLPNLKRYKESGSGDFQLDFEKRPLAAYLETSRGCDRECDFCTERLTKRDNFDLNYVEQVVTHYKANGIRTLLFSDDNILTRLNHKNGEAELIEIFQFLRREGMIWEFSVGLEIGRLLDRNGRIRRELIDAMFWNNNDPNDWQGAFRMLAPFENLKEGLTLYTKLRSWEEHLKVMEAIVETGLPQINMGVMFGWPDDTRVEIEMIRQRARSFREMIKGKNRTINNAFNTGMNLSLFCTMPLPGTPLYEEMAIAVRIAYDIEKHPELWNVFTSVLRGDCFAPEEITEIRRQIITEFESDQPQGKVRFQGQLNCVNETKRSFDWTVARVIDIYLATWKNEAYHTNRTERERRAQELKFRLELLRTEWGKTIRNQVELYQRLLEK